jgi:hypothetical protein
MFTYYFSIAIFWFPYIKHYPHTKQLSKASVRLVTIFSSSISHW